MLQKIKIGDLTVGMYVVDTGLSWQEHPYLYSQEGLLRREATIREIQEAGYAEVFVDTERGLSVGDLTPEGDDLTELLAASSPESLEGRVPIEEELVAATSLYADCLHIAHDILRDVKAGAELDLKASEALVDDVIASAMRNPDALVALSKLRRHDNYTFTHGVNVGVLATAFACTLPLSPEQRRELGLAGLFHDVGKTGISDQILNKPSRLTSEEFEEIKRHPTLGVLILGGHGLPEGVLRGVGEHHEKNDGSGYPQGVAGEDVHPWGAILGVADVYDALTSRRAYKEPILPTRALRVLYGMRDKDFRADLVERFIKFMGPYPVGTFVRLSNGSYGVVSGSNPGRTLRPEVLVLLGPDGRPVAPRRLVLSAEGEGEETSILEAVDPKSHGIDPLESLVHFKG